MPRYDDQRLVGAAMSLGANEARVRFTFEVGGAGYVVVRVVRRSGQGKVSTKEARLERVGRRSHPRRSGDRDCAPQSRRILGLSFDDFTRCVVLPQGAFARFLHDKPADRQALLVRLLDLGVYQRLMIRANGRAAAEQRVLDHLAGQLAELPFADAEVTAELVARRGRLDVLVASVAAAEPVVIDHEQTAATWRDAVERDDRLLAALRRINPPDWLGHHRELEAEATSNLAHSERALAESIGAVDRADELRRDLPELAALDGVLKAHERIAKGQVVVAEQAAALARAESAAAAAAARHAELQLERDRAHGTLTQLEAAHRAHLLAVDLRPGEPCPVCEQLVARLPLPVAPRAWMRRRPHAFAPTLSSPRPPRPRRLPVARRRSPSRVIPTPSPGWPSSKPMWSPGPTSRRCGRSGLVSPRSTKPSMRYEPSSDVRPQPWRRPV